MSKNSIISSLRDYLIKYLTRPFLLDTNDSRRLIQSPDFRSIGARRRAGARIELLNECEQRLITVKGALFFHAVIIAGAEVIVVSTAVFALHALLQVSNLSYCFWRQLNTGEVSNYIALWSSSHSFHTIVNLLIVTFYFLLYAYYNMVAFVPKFKNRPVFYHLLTLSITFSPQPKKAED